MYVAELHGMVCKKGVFLVSLHSGVARIAAVQRQSRRERQQHKLRWFRIDIISLVQFKLASAQPLCIAFKSVCLNCIRPAMTSKTATMEGMRRITSPIEGIYLYPASVIDSSISIAYFLQSSSVSCACWYIECTGIPVSFRKLYLLHVVILQLIFA